MSMQAIVRVEGDGNSDGKAVSNLEEGESRGGGREAGLRR